MTWLVWRQHCNQAYLAAAALAAFAVLLLVTGRQMASQYQSAFTSCAASHTCGNLVNTLTLGTPVWAWLLATWPPGPTTPSRPASRTLLARPGGAGS